MKAFKLSVFILLLLSAFPLLGAGPAMIVSVGYGQGDSGDRFEYGEFGDDNALLDIVTLRVEVSLPVSSRFRIGFEGSVPLKPLNQLGYLSPCIIGLTNRLYFLDGEVQPFLKAGVGLCYQNYRDLTCYSPQHENISQDRTLHYNLGGGVQIPVSSDLFIYSDLTCRYFSIKHEEPVINSLWTINIGLGFY